jgi:MFS family permease
MRVYRDFLRLPHAARLLGGTLLGRLPNGMGALVIVLFTREHGGGYSLGGGLSAIWVVSMALGQPTLGRAMDRFGQPRILFTSALAAAAGFALLAVTGLDPLPVAIGAVVVAGFATPPLEAGLRALWPAVLPTQGQVRTAYAVDAATQEMIFTVGPLLVVATVMVSTEAALIVTGLLGVAGTVVVTSSRPSQEWRGESREAHWAGPLRSSGLRVLLATLVCVGVALGAISVAVVTYADARGIAAASGVLLAANAGGALCGGFVHGARGGGARTRFPLLVTCLAAGYLPLAVAPVFPLMILFAFLAGVSLAPTLATAFTLVDALAPRGTVTEAFAWLVTAMALGAATGSALAGVAGDAAGAHAAFACAGGSGLLALAICLIGRRTMPAAAPEDRDQAAVPDAV